MDYELACHIAAAVRVLNTAWFGLVEKQGGLTAVALPLDLALVE